MTNPGESAILVGLAGFLATLPAGLQPAPVLTGLTFAVLGTMLRAGSEIQKAAEGSEPLNLARWLSWVSGGCISAPSVTLMWLIGLSVTSVPANIPELVLLFPISFYGQKGTIFCINFVTNTGKSVLGAASKSFPGGDKGDGKL